MVARSASPSPSARRIGSLSTGTFCRKAKPVRYAEDAADAQPIGGLEDLRSGRAAGAPYLLMLPGWPRAPLEGAILRFRPEA
jgi:hypothetical protein